MARLLKKPLIIALAAVILLVIGFFAYIQNAFTGTRCEAAKHLDADMIGDCYGCHLKVTPQVAQDWYESKHGVTLVRCQVCHGQPDGKGAVPFKRVPGVEDCAACHGLAIDKMTALYGTRPEDVLAAIGPGIGPCCFETHDDVPTSLEDRLGPAVRPFCHPLEQAAGKFTVDLKGIIAWELRQAGLAEEHIDTLPLCTACHPELYWSHRKMGDQRGNHAAMIALEG